MVMAARAIERLLEILTSSSATRDSDPELPLARPTGTRGPS
jgi:hypothetical protein